MRLETPRLLLREWQKSDLEELIDGLNHLEVSKWMAFVPYPYTKDDGERFIHFCTHLIHKSKEHFEFAITLKAVGTVIGGTSLTGITYDQGLANGGGIWLHPLYQGQGYGQEAWNRKIAFAFTELNLRRLESGFYPGNIPSCKMQERSGFQIEGLQRQKYLCTADHQLKDEYITGLLREEWQLQKGTFPLFNRRH
jgi:ribosomal-protein-alanine N-acetyltransferase